MACPDNAGGVEDGLYKYFTYYQQSIAGWEHL